MAHGPAMNGVQPATNAAPLLNQGTGTILRCGRSAPQPTSAGMAAAAMLTPMIWCAPRTNTAAVQAARAAQVRSGYRLTTNEGRNGTQGTTRAMFHCNGAMTSKHKLRRGPRSFYRGVGAA